MTIGQINTMKSILVSSFRSSSMVPNLQDIPKTKEEIIKNVKNKIESGERVRINVVPHVY